MSICPIILENHRIGFIFSGYTRTYDQDGYSFNSVAQRAGEMMIASLPGKEKDKMTMTKKVLILKGSPREHGNSSALADQLAVGAKKSGAEVESIFLHRLDIRPCDGCDFCRETGVCVIKDDMQPLYAKLLAADAIVLASPIYWFTFSAQLKICIDRWYALWNFQHNAFKDRPIGIILTYGDSDLYTSGAINAIHTFETMSRFLQAKIVGWIYGSMMDVGDAQKHPELMQQAQQLGEVLAQ